MQKNNSTIKLKHTVWFRLAEKTETIASLLTQKECFFFICNLPKDEKIGRTKKQNLVSFRGYQDEFMHFVFLELKIISFSNEASLNATCTRLSQR